MKHFEQIATTLDFCLHHHYLRKSALEGVKVPIDRRKHQFNVAHYY